MSETVIAHPGPAVTTEPGLSAGGAWHWARAILFSTDGPPRSLWCWLLVLRFAAQLRAVAFVHAIWTVPYSATGRPDTSACKSAHGIGACWAVIADKYRLILFGRYPFDEQWRPAICVALFIAALHVSAIRGSGARS